MCALITNVSQDVRTVAVTNLKLKQLYGERKIGGRGGGGVLGRSEDKRKRWEGEKTYHLRPRNKAGYFHG